MAELAIANEALYEVLVILLRNAVEAMEGRGRAAIGLSRVPGRMRIAVRDEGPGIGTGALEHIFEPGYTTKPGGSGYGLFLARRIVADAGGRLTPRGGAGRGTVMELELPLGRS